MNVKQRVHPCMRLLGGVRLGQMGEQKEPGWGSMGRGWCEALQLEQGRLEQDWAEVIFLTAQSQRQGQATGCQQCPPAGRPPATTLGFW